MMFLDGPRRRCTFLNNLWLEGSSLFLFLQEVIAASLNSKILLVAFEITGVASDGKSMLIRWLLIISVDYSESAVLLASR